MPYSHAPRADGQLLIFLIPVILPLWLCFVFGIMTLHTFQSRRRHRQHTISRSATPDPSSTPLLGATSLSHSRIDAIRLQTSTTSLATTNSSGASTPTLKSGSDSSSPILVDGDAIDDIPPRKGQVALLLTPGQKVMARNLQAHLQHAERVIGWFPWAYNAHAVLIARDVRRFKKHEEGRGVVREWATKVVDAGRR